jgi:hypothetical protein
MRHQVKRWTMQSFARAASLWEMVSIMGNFTWVLPTIPFAQARFRRMQSFYIEKARSARFSLKVKCSLSPEAKLDLQWWSVNLSYDKDKAFFPDLSDLEIFSDASMTGWRATYCNGV